jgi:glucose-6-phosphate 1-dehydrogenase
MSPKPRPRASGTTPRPKDHVIVVFGVTGDLAKRELLPGLFRLAQANLLPARYRIIGSARTGLSRAGFKEHVRQAVAQFGPKPEGEAWRAFEDSLTFAVTDPVALVAALQETERGFPERPQRLYHLAVPPVAFSSIVDMLARTELAKDARVIIEKPFGTDLLSARRLNDQVHQVFDETRVFRIDHFLGKESVDNILAFRFANGLFEPVWNREHIQYVQIDVPETLSIEGRAAFYEGTGAFRDMVVTHLFQVLGFVAMEPPTTLSASAIRDEKQKVFDALRPLDTRHVVRGQYDGYLAEPGVAAGSMTETFVALRAEIENWRWAGVPFHLRTGKSMASKCQVVTLGFREPVLRMFPVEARSGTEDRLNEVTIEFDDPGSIAARFLAKVPGPNLQLGLAEMVFRYENSFCAANGLTGYERLILDAMLGNQSLFTSAGQVERLWEVSEPLLRHPPPVEPYAPGSWGPPSVDKVAAPYRWHLPEQD